ncbi:MAG: MarR family transcriptional regulator [Pseudomonadota bacterium]|nr:MarR family transcriptional regulator [Pseudomonadota bacterium]
MGSKTAPPKAILEESAVHLLHRAGQCAHDVFLQNMDGAGLTPRQFAVLLTVAQNEGLSQSDLVERTGIDRSTLADIMRRIIKKGLVRRNRTREDARAYSVKLTDAGSRALGQAVPAALGSDQRVLKTLSPDKRRDFLATLSTIVRSLEQEAARRS